MDWWFWLEALLGGAGSCALVFGLLAASYSVRKAQTLDAHPPHLPDGGEWPKLSVIVPSVRVTEASSNV